MYTQCTLDTKHINFFSEYSYEHGTDVIHSEKKMFRHTSMIKPKTENVTFDC